MKTTHFLWFGLVFLLAACSGTTSSTELGNQEASLPDSFSISKMGLKVITSSINNNTHTMSTLYGNDLALKMASQGRNTEIQPGEVMALITWNQQDDDRWFGARIPGNIHSLELLKTVPVKDGKAGINYRRFEGEKLTLNSDTLHNQESIKYIFDQRPSVMP